MKKSTLLIKSFLMVLTVAMSQKVYSQSPELMSYQAVVRNASNGLVANQSVGVKISVLQNSAAGTVVYNELFNPNPTTNANGLLVVNIGSGVVLSGNFANINWGNGTYFIKTEIDPAGGTNYTLTSTSQLLSVPYALSAKSAQTVNGIAGTSNTISKFNSATGLRNSQITDNGTVVGINLGTSTASGRLDVRTSSTDEMAAIHGYANSVNSSKVGGVYGTYNTSNSGTGVQGIGYNGVSLANAPASFPSIATSTDTGVYGSAATAGVIGTSLAGNGVRGVSKSSSGTLGYSQATTTGGAVGVGNTIGVFANSVTIGTAAVPAVRYGVYGQASGAATNWAGYFNGNVNVIGSLAKGSGTFKIDHPLDPENKYLYHSFVESPDMMNIYNGNNTTDASGNATITLPAYFEALNKDFRYQLTVVGTFAQAIVSDEVSNNQFKIKTDKPNVKVSWQVTGIRKDKFADANRVIPEVEKEPENKGRFLHAKEWKQPINKEINYEINHSNIQLEEATRK